MKIDPKRNPNPRLGRTPCAERRALPCGMRRSGMGLIECTIYLALLSIILGLAIMAFYRANDNTGNLHRDAADILRALQAGERWREDVRTAGGPPAIERAGADELLRLPRAAGDVSYVFREGAVWRRALPNTNWLPVLPATVASTMQVESRRHVAAWRWDVELKSRPRASGARPVFSFTSVQTGAGQ